MSQVSPAVYQYLWRDFGLPAYKGFVLTLTGKQSLVIFAVICAFITYTETRTWIITRSVVIRTLRRIQLADAEDQNSILTQAEAIRSLVSREGRLGDGDMRTISPRFGITALTNIVLFLVLGSIIPYFLTGGLGTPTVQSKMTDTCIGYEDRRQISDNTANVADSFFKQCWLNASDISPSCGHMTRIMSDRPQLNVVRDIACPFHGDVCQDSTRPVTVEHIGLTPHDFGVNIKGRVLINHRVKCAPLKVERFLTPLAERLYGNSTIIWFGLPDLRNRTGTSNYGALLATRNGPNRYSNDYSGRAFASFLNPAPIYDLLIYPSQMDNKSVALANLHPDLRRDDGNVFVVMLRAGRSFYESDVPVDDPFYAAHGSSNSVSGLWTPDYEATALGCVEQYQYCLKQEQPLCTNWGHTIDGVQDLFILLLNNGEGGAAWDLIRVHSRFVFKGSLFNYLHVRRGTQVLLTSIYRLSEVVPYINPTEQWVSEVQAWFETAFLRARFTMLSVVQRAGPRTKQPDLDEAVDPTYLCDRILFLDDNYTNVDFLGLMATLSALLILCAISYTAEIIAASEKVAQICKKGYVWALPHIQTLFTLLRSGLVAILPQSWTRNSWLRQWSHPAFPFSQLWRERRFDPNVPTVHAGPRLDIGYECELVAIPRDMNEIERGNS
jgi:hypothetical protein